MNRLAAAVAVVLSATTVRAQADLPRLRRAAALPSVSVMADFRFSVNLVRLGDARDLPPQIARLEQELKTVPSDGARWQRLGLMRAERGEGATAQEAFQKAAQLFEKTLAARPEDGKIQAALAECYQALGRGAEAEALLRSAIRVSPREWRGWVGLGELLDTKAWKRLSLSDAELEQLRSTQKSGEPRLVAEFQKKLTPAAIAEARRLSDEARQCYDRAIAAGAQEPEPYLARAASRMLADGGLDGLLSVLTPGQVEGGDATMKRLLAPEVVADLRKARRLATDSPETITAVAAMECFWTVMERSAPLDDLGTEDAWKKLPQAAQAPIIEAMLRLVELSASPEKGVSAAASEGIGILSFVRGQSEKMEASLKRAASLRPLNARSFELLTLLYLSTERFGEIEKLYQERLQNEDTPRNRFLLAKALHKQQKTDDASARLTAALQKFPDDFLCNLGMAALKLQAGQIDGAGPYLMKAATHETAGKLGDDQRSELLTLLGVWQGLRGKSADARETLQKARSLDERNDAAVEALAALG